MQPVSHGETWRADMKRCGKCDKCFDFELQYLAAMEAALWVEAAGDITVYLNLMGVWGDLLIEQGIP